MGDLTPKQQRFVTEYLADPARNATKAAIAAGYGAKSAFVTASRLLRLPKISEQVSRIIAKVEVRSEISQARVLKEVEVLAFSDVSNYRVDDDGYLVAAPGAPEGVMRAVSSIKRRTIYDSEGGVTREVEFRLWDKPGVLKLAGRHVGLFPSRDKEAIEAAMEKGLENMIAKARAARAEAEAKAAAERPAIDVAVKTEAGGG